MIRIDMEKNNEFVANAHTWRETKIPYDQHRAVGKVLKELIPANCRLAEGGGIKIARTKAGHLTIKENKEVNMMGNIEPRVKKILQEYDLKPEHALMGTKAWW